MSTAFCGVDVPLWGSLPPLFIDGNSKITRDDGTFAEPKPNAFSLPHISCCPGSTPTCRSACLSADHKVLTADLRYVRLRDIKAGDRLVTFDEHRAEGERWRYHRTGTVRAIRFREAPVFDVRLASGKKFSVTSDHRWLIRATGASNLTWCETANLKIGYCAVRLQDEWQPDNTFEGGWLSGMYDGEGCLYQTGHACNLVLSQKAGPVLDRAVAAVARILGEAAATARAQKRDVYQMRIDGGRRKVARALGVLRPTRLLAKFKPEMLGVVSGKDLDPIVSVMPGGSRTIAEIDVDTGTLIAEGYAHHNCYVHGLEANAHDIYKRYSLNAMALHQVLMSGATALRAAGILAKWIRDNCTSFRWHVSGDVMSVRHADWIAEVCNYAPSVRFWIYTRTFVALPALRRARNLVVNASADSDNYGEALNNVREGWGDRVCYLTRDGSIPDDLPHGSVIFPDYSLRNRPFDRCRYCYSRDGLEPCSNTNYGHDFEHIEPPLEENAWWKSLSHEQRTMVCGADFFGQSESMRCGPCTKCLVSS